MKRFIYQLVSFNAETRVGMFRIRNEEPTNSKWKTVQLEVSRYLAGAIAKGTNDFLNDGDTFVGTKFVSSDNDQSFANNPFKLKHFKPTGNSDIPEHFVLELVNEGSSIKEEKTHINGEPFISYIPRYIKPKFYKRYVECLNTMMLADLPESVIIISPVVQ